VLRRTPALHERLTSEGLNVPGIIHTTILRFRQAPADLPRFLAGFDAIAAGTPPFAFDIREILLTVETHPYMRQGRVLRRFPLSLK
jgi:hypothetical protein